MIHPLVWIEMQEGCCGRAGETCTKRMLKEQICQMLPLQPKARISASTFHSLTRNSFFSSWNIFQKPENPLNLGHLRKVANINVVSLTTAWWMRCVLYLWSSEYDRLFQKPGWRIRRVFESGKYYTALLDLPFVFDLYLCCGTSGCLGILHIFPILYGIGTPSVFLVSQGTRRLN